MAEKPTKRDSETRTNWARESTKDRPAPWPAPSRDIIDRITGPAQKPTPQTPDPSNNKPKKE